MRTRLISLLILSLLGITTLSHGQSATWTKTFVNEADVRNGTTYQIEVSLVADTFETIIDTNSPAALSFVSGITGSAAWASIMADIGRDEIALDNNNTKAIISIRQDADYYLTADDLLSFTISDNYLEESSSPLTVTGNLTVNNQPTTITYSGDLASGVIESEIRTADQTFVLELTNNLWVSDIENEIGALTAIKSMFSGASEFGNLVGDLTSPSGDITLSGDERTLTLRFNQDGSYYIPASETVNVSVPTSLFQTSEASTSSTSFTISNEDPVITITPMIYNEADIQTGDIIFIITIAGDIWASDISSIQNSIVTGGEWDTDITPTLLVSRQSNTEVRVEVPQNAAFNIDYDETVSINIPSAAIENTTGAAIPVIGNHLVEITPPGISVAGSITSVIDEGDIRGGSYEIEINLSEDTWVAGVGTDGPTNALLVNSISCSPAQAGWNALLADILAGSNVSTPTPTGVVTITVPQKTDFDIRADISLSITAPSSLFTVSSDPMSDFDFASFDRIDPYMQISSIPTPLTEGDLHGAEITANIIEDTLIDGSFNLSNFAILMSQTGDAPYINAPADIQYVDNNTLIATLSFPPGMSFSTDRNLRLRIESGELGGSALTSSNSIPVEAIIEPIITSVFIPNAAMGINATVNVSITVQEDDGGNFEYASGTVAGRTLSPLIHLGGTAYQSTITIIENSDPEFLANEDILVENLQLRNGTALGNSYDFSFDRLGDPLDSRRPDLELINFSNGTYGVGDVITAIVVAADNEGGLAFDKASSTMNSLPLNEANFTFHESGAGSYQINYEVYPGDNNTSDIPVNIIMLDSVGNPSDPLISYTGTSPVIYGEVPGISSVDVTSSGIKTFNAPNNAVELLITTDTRGLVFTDQTIVNNVNIASGRLAIDSIANIYTLTYTIDQADGEVLSAGLMEATIIMADPAGNEVEFPGALSNNDITIFTALPSGNIYGGSSMCEGDSVEIFVDLIGRGPFDIRVLEGGALMDIFVDVPADYSFYVKPNSDLSYTLNQITDIYGNIATPNNTTDVEVNPNPAPNITNGRTSFQVNEPPVLLTADSIGGQFTGIGVVTSESKFYPGVADTTNSPHTIYYTYVHPPTGCVGVATKQFNVLIQQAEILNLPEIICYNEPPLTIEGNVALGGDGSFSLYEQRGNEVLGALVNIVGTNQAILSVENLARGTYRVLFTYEWNGKPGHKITQDFILDDIAEVKYISRPKASVCINNSYTVLETNLDATGPNYSYEGDGVTYNFSLSEFIYTPAEAILGVNEIKYTFTSDRGCTRADSFEIVNYDVPDISFEADEVCIAEEGSEIEFTNLTSESDTALVQTWTWYYDDGDATEDENYDIIGYDSVPFPDVVSHFYRYPGDRSVSLEILTKEGGCEAIYESEIVFGDKPIADFNWTNDCFLKGSEVAIQNLSGPTASGITWDSLFWHIYHDDISVMDTIIKKTDKSDIGVVFDTLDNHYIELTVRTDLGCTDSRLDSIILKPTITPLIDSSYYETFDNSDSEGKWSTDKFTDANSWVYDELDWVYDSSKYNKFMIEAGDLSWYIRKEISDTIEDSWIQSPCFDFDSLERPMIRLDMMRSFDETWDGAVLQYTLNNGDTWTRLGEIGEGINWYNSFDILGKPGGSQGSGIGWSGEEAFSPDTNWVNVAHDLNELKDQQGIIFGIFYDNAIRTSEDNKGIAVDNIYIGERTKRALIEHFTDAGYSSAASANAIVDNFTAQNILDVTNLQYHMHYSGDDQMNENNSAPASSRSFLYGISGIPYALMDGGVLPSYQYDFVSTEPSSDQLSELTLESPIFELDLRFQLFAERLATTIDIRALQDYNASAVVLYVVVVEKEVTEYGANAYKNVVLDMLPSPAGTEFSQGWARSDEESLHLSWRYGEGVDLNDDLMIVTFIQDRESGKVLQVASEDVTEFGLGTHTNINKSLKVYPNPANNQLNIEFDESKFGDVVLDVTDMTGRTVLMYELYQGEQYIQLDIEQLGEGAYILQSKENGRVSSRTNFIKVR